MRVCKDTDRAIARHDRKMERIRLCKLSYKEYLKSDHWKKIRERALRASRYKCQLCNKANTILDVHHRTYERRGREFRKDVIVLCRSCHVKFHDKLKTGD